MSKKEDENLKEKLNRVERRYNEILAGKRLYDRAGKEYDKYGAILANNNADSDSGPTGRDKAKAAAQLALEEAGDFAKEKAGDFVKEELDYAKHAGKKGMVGRLFDSAVSPHRYVQRFIGFFVFAVVSFVILTYIQGPLQMVDFAEYLQETHYTANNYIFNNRLGGSIVYAASANHKELRNLNIIGNAIAQKYELKLKAAGITPDYGGTNRIKAIIIDPNGPKGPEALQKLEEKGISTSELKPGADGKIRVNIDRTDMGNTSTRFRRLVVGSMVSSLDMNNVSGAMASRVMKLRAGVDFHPFKNLVRSADEKGNAYTKRVLESIKENIRNGTGSPEYSTKVEEGTEEDGSKTRSANSQNTEPEMAGQLDAATADQPATAKVKSLRTKITGGFGVTAFIGIVCAIQKIGDSVVQMTYENVNTPMVRTAGFIISGASQAKSGIDTNEGEVGIANDLLYDNASNTSWVDAASIQRNMGENPTGLELPESAQPTTGDRSSFFDSVDNFINAVPGASTVCSAITSTIGGYLFSAVGIALTSTGPASLILNTVGQIGQDMIMSSFMDDLVAWLSNDMIDPTKGGAYLGAVADTGMRLAANDQIIAAGGTELAPADEQALAMEVTNETQQENAHKSLYARYFDPYEYHSLANTVLMRYSFPFRATSAKAMITTPFRILGSAVKNFGSVLTQRTFADEPDGDAQDYGFARFGFTVGEIDNVDFINPYDNEDVLLSSNDLNELNTKYGTPCFGVTIDPTTGIITTERKMVLYKNIPAECKDRNNETLTRYRFLLVDTYANLAAACYEDVDISPRDPCAELGLGDVSTVANAVGEGSFRVATFNVLGNRHTTGNDGWPSGATRMNDAFKELDANNIQVAGLQELEKEQRAKFIELAGANWGIFPDTENYKNLSSYDSIVWKTSEFELVGSGYRTNLQYFDGRELDAPWVKLKHKASGQIIYITNTHDPDNTTEAPNQQKYRVANAKKHKADLLEHITAGEKSILLGDFNSNATLGVKDAGLKRDELTYCILTDGGDIQNAYDTSNGKSGTCPTKKNFSIDHIYHSKDLNVSGWKKIDTLEARKITDHPLVYADVNYGGDATGATGGNTSKDGWQWPIIGYTKKNISSNVWGAYTKKGRHKAIDMGAPIGTKVVAAHDGTVTKTTFSDSCGFFYLIKATDTPYWMTYQHLQHSQYDKAEGAPVQAGEVIGEVGKYGKSCGSFYHLHFGVEKTAHISVYADPWGGTINPLDVLP